MATQVQMSSKECQDILANNIEALNELQQKLFSRAKHSLLVVFQAMDAAGKDSTIKAVFSGMNPQGFLVSGFKQPSKQELAHDYLWRVNSKLPARGHIGVFNRSHYEEVLVCKVHPEYILYQNLPDITSLEEVNADFWEKRYRQINNYEQHLSENGYTIIKFFLHVSKDEQEERFRSRMEKADKHWKFNIGDLKERQLWDEYMSAYNDAIRTTSTAHAPWYVLPADDKDYLRAQVSSVIRETMEGMDLAYPQVSDRDMADIAEADQILKAEKK